MSARGRCDEREGHMSAPTITAEFDAEDGVTTATAVIDNGSYGSRSITFETGRLAARPPAPSSSPRRHHAAVGHHGRPPAQGAVRLLPADGRRRGADVRRRAHPRLVLPPRGPPVRGRDPHLPPDRPPAAPDLRQGPAQRGPGRHHRHALDPSTSTTCSRSTAPRRPPSSPACRSPARSAAPASP